MISATYEVELSYPWESLQVVLSDPAKVLSLFPYFESFNGKTVRFKVHRFLFNFGYEFQLTMGFYRNRAVYTFTGKRGILTVTFEFIEPNKLRVTASWSGFMEHIMGKPLKMFVKGIAESVRDYCAAKSACPEVRKAGEERIVENMTPDLVPPFLRSIAWDLGSGDFIITGISEDGTSITIRVEGNILREIRVKTPNNEESIVETEIPLEELTREMFEDLPIRGKFLVKIKRAVPHSFKASSSALESSS